MLASRRSLPTVAPSRRAPGDRSPKIRACLQCTIAKRRLIEPHLSTPTRHASSAADTCCSNQQPSIRLPVALAALSKDDTSQSGGPDNSKEVEARPRSEPASSPSTSSVSKDTSAEQEDSLPVRLALQLLQFYRSGISPMMAPSCRYLPSCSEYSIQSYKRFGAWKGTVLTAWRLMRCNPLGSSGYDPPQWPPPGLSFLYGQGSWEYSPQVSVVIGAAAGAWLAHELWQEIAAMLWPYQ